MSRATSAITPISTHSPRARRTSVLCGLYARRCISTHSPRARRTRKYGHSGEWSNNFNSLAPRGANLNLCAVYLKRCKFQLTRPARGEPERLDDRLCCQHISTHSPRAGRTPKPHAQTIGERHFNSLAPRGANQPDGTPFTASGRISTHSPRAGRTPCR